jgi:NitT/TauT family transport system ATP-binding protein
MSGGMRQRVSLARALAVDPEIVLLDESFSQLDPVTSRELRVEFRNIVKTYGKTCVFVTHNIDDAIEIADRIFVLAAPARVACELTLSDETRGDTNAAARMREQIEQAIGSP